MQRSSSMLSQDKNLMREIRPRYLANLDDNLVVCNGSEWFHDSIHSDCPKNGICRLQDSALVLVQDMRMHKCIIACVNLLELKFDRPLGAEIPVPRENRAFGDILKETRLIGAFATYDSNFGQLHGALASLGIYD